MLPENQLFCSSGERGHPAIGPGLVSKPLEVVLFGVIDGTPRRSQSDSTVILATILPPDLAGRARCQDCT